MKIAVATFMFLIAGPLCGQTIDKVKVGAQYRYTLVDEGNSYILTTASVDSIDLEENLPEFTFSPSGRYILVQSERNSLEDCHFSIFDRKTHSFLFDNKSIIGYRKSKLIWIDNSYFVSFFNTGTYVENWGIYDTTGNLLDGSTVSLAYLSSDLKSLYLFDWRVGEGIDSPLFDFSEYDLHERRITRSIREVEIYNDTDTELSLRTKEKRTVMRLKIRKAGHST